VTYRVEYNGTDAEISTLDAAVEAAKHAILTDVGPVSGWTIEHDEAINDWFIQGVRNGELVGSTAVVAGPEPVMGTDESAGSPHDAGRYHPHRAPDGFDDTDEPARSVAFAGVSAIEAFGKATTWLAGRADEIEVLDVAWRQPADRRSPCQVRIYYRAGGPI
jgi:hypothetical protein